MALFDWAGGLGGGVWVGGGLRGRRWIGRRRGVPALVAALYWTTGLEKISKADGVAHAKLVLNRKLA